MTERGIIYRYAWGNNPVRAKLKGRLCRVLTAGARRTIMIEMLDTGERVTTSLRALRRLAGGGA